MEPFSFLKDGLHPSEGSGVDTNGSQVVLGVTQAGSGVGELDVSVTAVEAGDELERVRIDNNAMRG